MNLPFFSSFIPSKDPTEEPSISSPSSPMWFISTSNPRTSTTINTSSYTVSNPHTDSNSDTFHPILQLTTFGLWKSMDSLSCLLGWSQDPNPTTPCAISGAGWARRSAPHAVSLSVVGARLHPDCILQWHAIQTNKFRRMVGMWQSASPVILYVECLDGGPRWEWIPAAQRQRRRCVQAIVKTGRKKKEKPCTGYCRIYSHSFLDNPLIKQW